MHEGRILMEIIKLETGESAQKELVVFEEIVGLEDGLVENDRW